MEKNDKKRLCFTFNEILHIFTKMSFATFYTKLRLKLVFYIIKNDI